MKLATNNQFDNLTLISVLVDFGSYSNRFDYLDKKNLGTEIGDIVLVRLKGRLIHGLVIDKNFPKEIKIFEDASKSNQFKYLSIESILRKRTFEIWWRNWLQHLAAIYKVSDLRMIKTALPPGAIGKLPKKSFNFWISKCKGKDFSNFKLTRKQTLLIKLLHSIDGAWQSEIIKSGFTSNQINKLHSKNLIKKIKRQKSETNKIITLDKVNSDSQNIPIPTEQQKKAIEYIRDMRPGDALLLWGETGSGKTEVYLRITKRQLDLNKSCLIMAPEIGLIPQLLDRFTNRFKKNVYEYHSNCSSNHRQFVWQKILDSNEPIIIIGTRSSIFLPIKNLGIIIIDEEHDNSYKQESPMPCYDAREVAIDRAKRFKTCLIFGTATPSLNIWKKVYFERKYKYIRMTKRISVTETPEIIVVDMCKEFKTGNSKILSRELLNSLAELKNKKEQAIILIPRRGYSGFLSCRNCGHVVNCPNCDTALTVHVGSRGTKWLSCHWCNLKRKFIYSCPDCNSRAFKPFGIGTQKIIEFLNNELPQLKILRFDKDTTSGKDGHRKILSQFSKGNADIIVGTQMLAKGIDIPNVTLSVILAADGLLHRPDLCSEEKSLQLFLQLAGRSGRADKNGKVIFQTYQPHHPVIAYLKNRNYEGFLKENLSLRKKSRLFPFCDVCLLRLSGTDNNLTEKTANKLAEYLNPLCTSSNWQLIGPAPSMVSKIGKKFRWQLLMYGPNNSDAPIPNNENLLKLIPKNIFLLIDVNPIEI